VRITVLAAFAVTLWAFGPRAGAVLAARFRGVEQRSPTVDLDRVAVVARPAWLATPLLLQIARELQPFLHGGVPILDEASALTLRQQLAGVAWVQQVRLERVFPDRFRAAIDLRRPVLAVHAEDGSLLAEVDAEGTALPPVVLPDLPAMQLRADGGAAPRSFEFGKAFPDARVQAAAAVAVEWRDAIAPLVSGCPMLLEVDATNLGYRFISHPRYPEIRVALQNAAGEAVWFGYDRAPTSTKPRVPAAVKAQILQQILHKYPALTGLTGGDLRFQLTWEKWLLPAPGRDPVGPWGPK
jgi:hypothetical protein